MRSHLLRVPVQRRWEVALQIRCQIRIVGQIGVQQQSVQVDLAVRHQDRDLGRDQPPSVRSALRERRLRRQELELAIEPRGPLQVRDHPGVDVAHRDRLGQRDRHRLRLRVAPVDDLLGDRVGHRRQQLVAPIAGRRRGAAEPVEQDLDVDLVV